MSGRADLVIRGQVVLAAEADGLTTAEAVGIAEGRVVSAGTAREALDAAAPRARVVDAREPLSFRASTTSTSTSWASRACETGCCSTTRRTAPRSSSASVAVHRLWRRMRGSVGADGRRRRSPDIQPGALDLAVGGRPDSLAATTATQGGRHRRPCAWRRSGSARPTPKAGGSNEEPMGCRPGSCGRPRWSSSPRSSRRFAVRRSGMRSMPHSATWRARHHRGKRGGGLHRRQRDRCGCGARRLLLDADRPWRRPRRPDPHDPGDPC